jgi:hypothetical protein
MPLRSPTLSPVPTGSRKARPSGSISSTSIFAEIQKHCREDALIGSSTSGFKPSELQQGAARPEQIFVAHPFNPVYLLPVIELVGVEATLRTRPRRA